MVTVPAFVWRGGFFRRALMIGTVVGICLGLLAWVDSGAWLGGVIAIVITGVLYGILMPRRMARYWPGAKQLSGEDRVTVVRAARRGERVGDPKLAQAVADYSKGIHAAVEAARPFRWLVPLVLVVAVGTAVFDAVFGSWGNVIASGIYFVALLVELFWWPARRDELLANADRAAEISRHFSDKQDAGTGDL
jgi:hypothetical protein